MVGLIWFLVIVVFLVGAIAVWMQSRPRRLTGQDPRSLKGLRRTVFTLQIGDIVQFEARDWFVEGVLTYDENGFQWLEYLLQDQDEVRWLTVEEDDRVEMLWMTPHGSLDVARPGPRSLEVAGERYALQESGTAQMTRRGNTLNRQAEVCRYYEYRAESGDGHLSMEDWEGDIEVTVGYAIRPQDLNLLPGDGERVYNARG